MRNRCSKLITALPVIAGLAIGANVFADGNTAKDIDYSFWDRTGDFMWDMSYHNKSINRNERTDLRKIIRGGKDAIFYAMDPAEAFRSRIAYLNTKEGKKKYNNENLRLLLINRFKDFINYLEENKIKPSRKSLEKLSAGARDGILEPKEFDGVEDNMYAIVELGGDPYRVFYLTSVVSDTTPSQYQAKISELENKIKELEQGQIQIQPQARPEAPKQEIPIQPETQKSQAEKEIPIQPKSPTQIQTQPQPIKEVPKQETKKQEKDYRSVYLLAQQTANGNLNSYITSIGARLNPFKDLNIGFGANLDIGFGLDKQTDSYTAPLSAGRSAYGTMTETNKYSMGGSLEAQFGPFVLGGGIDYKNWTKETIEQILSQSGGVVKSNTNSVPNRQVFGKVYGVVEMPLGNNFKLGMILGYNGKDKEYFGIRGGIKIK